MGPYGATNHFGHPDGATHSEHLVNGYKLQFGGAAALIANLFPFAVGQATPASQGVYVGEGLPTVLQKLAYKILAFVE